MQIKDVRVFLRMPFRDRLRTSFMTILDRFDSNLEGSEAPFGVLWPISVGQRFPQSASEGGWSEE